MTRQAPSVVQRFWDKRLRAWRTRHVRRFIRVDIVDRRRNKRRTVLSEAEALFRGAAA